MADPQDSRAAEGSELPEYTGPERRSGLERRHEPNPQPPPGAEERRHFVRRKADRMAMEGTIRIGVPGPGGRLYRRVRIAVPVICRPVKSDVSANDPPVRGLSHTLAPGGLGMILDEEFRIGTHMEILVRFEGDLLSADVRVVSVIPRGGQFLHNCRFTRLGTADRAWLIEYLRIRDAPPA